MAWPLKAAITACEAHRQLMTKRLSQAQRDIQDVACLLHTAIDALHGLRGLLTRARDRMAVGSPCPLPDQGHWLREYDRVVDDATFNGRKLLDGSFAREICLQVGANAGQSISFSIAAMTREPLGLTAAADGAVLAAAIVIVDRQRAELEAALDRLAFYVTHAGPDGASPPGAAERIGDAHTANEVWRRTQALMLGNRTAALQAHAGVCLPGR